MNHDARMAAYRRCLVVVLGLYLAGVGINVLTRGDVLYVNWLRSPAAAPLALILGIILMIVGLRLPG